MTKVRHKRLKLIGRLTDKKGSDLLSVQHSDYVQVYWAASGNRTLENPADLEVLPDAD